MELGIGISSLVGCKIADVPQMYIPLSEFSQVLIVPKQVWPFALLYQ